MAPVKLPATKRYRVSIAGASYQKHKTDVGADGQDVEVVTRELALFGEEIELTDREAKRLTDLDAVKPADEPLSYEEMDTDALAKLADERGIDVNGSAVDGQALKDDYINALRIYDQAQGTVRPAGPVAPPEPPGPPPPLAEADPQLVERIQSGGEGGKPLTVDETVALAENDPALAEPVLAAEVAASGGSPRKGVQDGLRALIER
jgi:hypothetical protein